MEAEQQSTVLASIKSNNFFILFYFFKHGHFGQVDWPMTETPSLQLGDKHYYNKSCNDSMQSKLLLNIRDKHYLEVGLQLTTILIVD